MQRLLLILVFMSSCTGELSVDSTATFDPDQTIAKNTNDGGREDLIEEVDPPILGFAGSGDLCSGGKNGRYLVLSDTTQSCESQLGAIQAKKAGQDRAGFLVVDLLELEREGDRQNLRYCPVGGMCSNIDFTFKRESTSPFWAATIGGKLRTQVFVQRDCDYQSLAPPLEPTPASGISIKEIAVYQAVKIPIFKDGQFIAEHNAPIIAQKPGLLRVSFEKEEGWVSREIVAKLTIGEYEKEIRFTPTFIESELKLDSTLNFEFLQDEFPDEGAFSLALTEVEACSDRTTGSLGNHTVDSSPGLLKVESFVRPLEIFLVPIQYDGDGSGRLPNLEGNALAGYEKIAANFFPVGSVNISVRPPIAYSGTLDPGGAGFNTALNFCLSQRPNEPLPHDMYYCVFQPTQARSQFCGRCVAGIAPIGGLGGIGIDWSGSGTGTFAHEMGHGMRRRHAPCGTGGDGAYPYAEGGIGSVGYAFSGSLIDPNRFKDIMGYCTPKWISDYTYKGMFEYLKNRINRELSQELGEVTRWKSLLWKDPKNAEWGRDFKLKILPEGKRVEAQFFDRAGRSLGKTSVFVQEIADDDSYMLFLDSTDAPYRVQIPGFGEFSLP